MLAAQDKHNILNIANKHALSRGQNPYTTLKKHVQRTYKGDGEKRDTARVRYRPAGNGKPPVKPPHFAPILPPLLFRLPSNCGTGLAITADRARGWRATQIDPHICSHKGLVVGTVSFFKFFPRAFSRTTPGVRCFISPNTPSFSILVKAATNTRKALPSKFRASTPMGSGYSASPQRL